MLSDCRRLRAARPWRIAAAALLLPVLGAAPASALMSSTTTTTTLPPGTTTTTMFVPTDVTGGGDFEGGFPAKSFDSYVFELTEPRVLVAETGNGFGGCPGDTFVELRRPGAPGNCNLLYGDELACIAFDDDSGIALCSRLVKSILEPGSYQIRVTTYGGAKLLRYFLHVEFVKIECGNDVLEITEQCDDGNLAAGDCCSPACRRDAAGTSCDDALFCNGIDSCDDAAACSKHIGDPCPGADGDGDCSETCDEGADACTASDAAGSSCNDGLFCNGPDTCDDSSCGLHGGNPCPGEDGDGDCSETCDDTADACTGPDANGSVCDDGVFCNGADTCASGTCSAHAGSPCSPPDGDFNCAESCNEPADNCTASDPDGSACDDGLACNGADTCLAGTCDNHLGSPCAGVDGDANCSESCSDSVAGCTNPDPEGAACDDGVFCNGVDHCSGGSCSIHAGDPCQAADGDGNCTESCNETGDSCTSADPGGSACDDADPCTAVAECDGSGSCLGFSPVDCNDDNDCTVDSCLESTQDCSHTPIPDCPAATTTTTTLPSFVCGDVSGDGLVKASDALGVLKAAVGGAQCTGKVCTCDTSGNGALTAGDALLVLKFAVGAPVTLNCSC